MSGHSKWHSIRHKKGAADKKRAAAFTRATRDIIVAAREGGGDPGMNFSLRLAVEKAKAINMPKDNITRAIKRGTGEDKEGAVFESIVYEGFGPAQVAVIVEVMTDNRNRSSAEIKHMFAKAGGNMAGPGSVSWQFQHVSAVHISSETVGAIADRDAFDLAVIDAGADDILDEDGGLVVVAPIANLQKIVEAIEGQGVEIADSGLEYRAKETIAVAPEAQDKVESFFAVLDEHGDVQNWYTNAV